MTTTTNHDPVAVPDTVIAAVGELFSRYGNSERWEGMTSEYPRALVQALVDYLSEDLGCDHGINICMCAEQAVVKELILALDGKALCPRCGGDGIDFDPVRRAQAETEAIEAGTEAGWDAGLTTCSHCAGTGTVSL